MSSSGLYTPAIENRFRGIVACDATNKLFHDRRSFSVYAIVNRKNGHLYFGITARTPQQRLRKHFYMAMSGRLDAHFARAIRKFGPENFNIYVIWKSKTKEEAYRQERGMIEDFYPEYNSTLGGEGVHGLKMSPQSRDKMRQSKLRRSDRREIAIKAAMTLARPIVCVNTGETFLSSREGAEKHGLSRSQVWVLANSGRASRKGLKFRFAEPH